MLCIVLLCKPSEQEASNTRSLVLHTMGLVMLSIVIKSVMSSVSNGSY